MKYALRELIDIKQFQMLQDRLNEIYTFPSAIIDNEGNILTATAWQDVCTQFHRKNPECEKECIKSDQYILDHLHEAQPAISYRCPHGLIDNAAPIVIEGVHLGNFFTGQFFLEAPDLNFFRSQAKKYGFDEEAYLEAVKKVPIWTKEQLNNYLFFIKGLIEVIASVGLKNIKEIENRKKLEESEECYRALFERSGDYSLILEIGPDGFPIITDLNEAAMKALGYAREEIVGKSISVIEPDFSPESDAERNRLLVLGRMFIVQRCRKDGTRFLAEVNAKKVQIGGKSLILSVERDITERKKAEEALRENERMLSTLMSNLPGMVYRRRLDRDWTMEFISEGCLELTGFSPADLIRNRVKSYNDIIHPDDQAPVWDHVQSALWEKRPYELTYRIIAADGSEKWVWERGRGIFTSSGELLFLEGFITDITERKTLEDQLRQSHRMEAVGQLAGGIAHDFNNILVAILGYSELSLAKHALNDSLRKNIEEIQKAGKRAETLTRQLLAFSRKQVLQPQVIDLNVLILDMDKMLRRLIGENIDLVTIPDPSLDFIEADPGQIEQVIVNLAVNSRDAMPNGGKLTIETKNVELDEKYARNHVDVRPGSHVMLAVSDTGAGIDKKIQKQIFEPFFTTKPQGKGTGLGLSTVYGIVKQSGGNIWVYSEIGQGTTFKVYFPKAGSSAAVVISETPSVSSKVCSELVLVVEDDEIVRKLISLTLSDSGYKVYQAANGDDAMLKYDNLAESIHILVTDVIMPSINGRELSRRLTLIYPQMKTLYVSGYTDNAIVHHGVLEPGLHFLQKPFLPDALRRKVREVLDVKA